MRTILKNLSIREKRYLLFILALQVIYGKFFVHSDVGLDAGWSLAINYAVQKNLVFGQDIVFNYGPLAYLNTLNPPDKIHLFILVLVQLWTIFQILFIYSQVIRTLKSNWKYFFLFFLIFPLGAFADFSFTYLLFLIFHLQYYLKERKEFVLWFALINTWLLFYVKVNLNMIACLLFTLSCLYFSYKKILSWKHTGFLFLLLMTGTLAGAKLLNVDLTNFLKKSLWLISDYSEGIVNVIEFNKSLIVFFLIEAIGLGIFIRCSWKLIQEDSFNILIVLVLLGYYFVSFKQAHTALNFLNLYGFAINFPWLFLLLFYQFNKPEKIEFNFYLIGVLSLLSVLIIRMDLSQYSFKKYLNNLTEYKTNLNPIRKFSSLFEFDYAQNFRHKEFKLPQNILDKIGREKIDFITDELDYIFNNELNYQPRPLLQTYATSSSRLNKLNLAFYQSENSPQKILLRLNDFRGRNAFWNETPLLLEIFSHYQLDTSFADVNHPIYLMEKTTNSRNYDKKILDYSDKIELNKEYPIPNDGIVILKGEFNYSILGKIYKLLVRPAYLFAEIKTEKGTIKNFYVNTLILKGGIISNFSFNNGKELEPFLLGNFDEITKVKSIRFYTNQAWAFEN